MARDTIKHTFTVAAVLCIVCSVLVSLAAVSLRPIQEANKELDRKKNILQAAQLFGDIPKDQTLEEFYEARVESLLINLETGEPVEDEAVNQGEYNPREAARDPALSTPVEPKGALPGISRRENFAFIYLVQDNEGQLSQVVFPIYGKGLWSTLYGFIAVYADTTTVGGITFYQHGETPGLGGEVDNPNWKADWKGKKLFDPQWNLEIEVLKGKVNSDDAEAVYQVDGLSGATITTRGVSDLIRYWMGKNGFGSYLVKLRSASGTGASSSHVEDDTNQEAGNG